MVRRRSGCVITCPSGSTIGAEPESAKIVPSGKVSVATGTTAMPSGPVRPAISFSSTSSRVPSSCTASLLM